MMEVAGSRTEAFEDSEAKEESAETLLGSSTLTLAPLVPDSPSVHRSQPIPITSNRQKCVESFSSSFPSIPNPFPELSGSSVFIRSIPPKSKDKHLIKVFGEDSHSTALWISPGATAREVCNMLVCSAHCSDQENWALLEVHPTLGLERCLEDHEVVLDVQEAWSPKGDTRFMFSKNYAKYEFFRKPVLFFPESMISDSADVSKGMTSSELIKNLLKSGACPEIQGFLHVKNQNRKVWKEVYFFLRRSGLYSSTKGSSKEPRHLKYVADQRDLNVYTVVNSCNLYGAPTEFTFCIKPSKNSHCAPEQKFLCAENEQTRTCWTSAFRLFKHGKQLQYNYQLSKSAPQKQEGTNLSDGKSKSEASLVAMDFSGKAGGRVIQNPMEAQSAEREEGLAWRVLLAYSDLGRRFGSLRALRLIQLTGITSAQFILSEASAPLSHFSSGWLPLTNRRFEWQRREALRCSLPNLNSALPSSIHKTQLWFHGGVSRKDAERLIEKQGLVDGMFLIRESQQHAHCFVLSLCYQLKTKHYLVIPFEDDGRKYFTMDDGATLFIDLLQLVEFHQINKGVLPVCLKHPCVCVAL